MNVSIKHRQTNNEKESVRKALPGPKKFRLGITSKTYLKIIFVILEIGLILEAIAAVRVFVVIGASEKVGVVTHVVVVEDFDPVMVGGLGFIGGAGDLSIGVTGWEVDDGVAAMSDSEDVRDFAIHGICENQIPNSRFSECHEFYVGRVSMIVGDGLQRRQGGHPTPEGVPCEGDRVGNVLPVGDTFVDRFPNLLLHFMKYFIYTTVIQEILGIIVFQ